MKKIGTSGGLYVGTTVRSKTRIDGDKRRRLLTQGSLSLSTEGGWKYYYKRITKKNKTVL